MTEVHVRELGGGERRERGTRNEEASHALPLVQHEVVIEGGQRHERLVGKEMQNREKLNGGSELSASRRAWGGAGLLERDYSLADIVHERERGCRDDAREGVDRG